MAYRFTDTNKWRDAWFLDLAPMEKLLWVYLYENCDIAGFYEVCKKRIMFDLGINKSTFEGALKGLDDKIIWSFDGNIIFIKNFLRHQKNLPLRENNKAHIGILRRFENYRDRFDFDLIEACISASLDGVIKGLTRGFKGASKGLTSPTGIGIGNNNTVISSNKDITISSNIDKEEENEYERVTESFNLICTSLPKVRTISNKRKRHIKARLKDFGGDMNLLEDVFRQVEASDYLSGRSGVWRASFDWIMGSQDNLVKIMEGNYDNKKRTGQNAITDEQLASAIRSGLERGKRMYGEQ